MFCMHMLTGLHTHVALLVACCCAQMRIVREDGIAGLFRGGGPTVVRAMALNMGMLASNDQAKEMLQAAGFQGQTAVLGGAMIAGARRAATGILQQRCCLCMLLMRVCATHTVCCRCNCSSSCCSCGAVPASSSLLTCCAGPNAVPASSRLLNCCAACSYACCMKKSLEGIFAKTLLPCCAAPVLPGSSRCATRRLLCQRVQSAV
jgi:hypothetical protein